MYSYRKMADMATMFQGVWDYIRQSFSGLVTKFIVAVVVLLAGFIIGKILGRLLYKVLHSFEINNNLHKLTGVTMKVEEISESFLTYFVYFITIVTVLQQIGLATTVLNMIAGGIMIILILSTFLGIKDFIPNAIAGIMIQNKKVIKEGETIKVKGMQGKITGITLVETKIETKKGDIIFIPNSALTKTEIIKISKKKRKKSKKKSKKKVKN